MTQISRGTISKRTWKWRGRKTTAYVFAVTVDGKRIRRQYPNRAEAQAALDRFREEARQGPVTIRPTMTLAAAIDRYLQAKTGKRSIESDGRYLRELATVFGCETPLADITSSRISEWRDGQLSRQVPHKGMLQPVAAASINRPLAALRHLLRLACEEWECLEKAPLIRLLPEPPGRVRYLTEEEQVRLIAACRESKNPELPVIVTVLLQTGGRRSEVLGLTWERGVDLARGVVTFHGTKNGESRSVPMTQAAYEALAGLPDAHEGRVFRTRSIRTAFERAVARVGLDDFHIHDCRHTFASSLVTRGATLQAVKELLGHKDLKMTLRYAHLSPAHLRDAIGLLEPRRKDGATDRDAVALLDEVSGSR